jgi:hypothetical protein
MADKVSLGQVGDAINDILADYKDYCDKIIYEDIDEAGTVAREEVKKLAPVAVAAYKRWEPNAELISPGKYKKSWRKKTEGKGTSKPSTVVYSGQYSLVHLLENGHAKKGGGRVPGFAHAAPAEEKAEETLMRKLESDL